MCELLLVNGDVPRNKHFEQQISKVSYSEQLFTPDFLSNISASCP